MKTAPHKIEVGEQSLSIVFVRNRKARRYILRLLPGGTARVTIPRGGTIEHAVEFARKNTRWLQRQILRAPPEWRNGSDIFLRGSPERLEVVPNGNGFHVAFAGARLQVASEAEARRIIEKHLRDLASEELVPRTLELARQHDLEVRSVQIRNQRSRWGSCSARRTLSLNWRLIQTPEFVRDYIIIHELMHLREMNHSSRFWAHVAAACPDYAEAERWLRKNARLLR